jgi:hypothetical protein
LNINSNKLTENFIYKTTFLIALAVSIFAVSAVNPISCIISIIICAVVYSIDSSASLLPIITFFLIVLHSIGTHGEFFLILSLTIGSIIFVILSRFEKIKNAVVSSEFGSALSISVALTATILITTKYFGIGATGNTVIEMIKSYISLGFHPNWRGILYGTIVMVLMITYPRKFKKLSKIISPLFAALLVAYVLNLFLIPKGTVSTIELVETPEFEITNIFNCEKNLSFDFLTVIRLIVSSLAIAVTLVMSNCESVRKENYLSGCSSAVISVFCGFSIPAKVVNNSKEFGFGVLSAAIIAIISLITNGYERMPVSACAVVFIVGAWQCVDISKIKLSFKGSKNIIIFCLAIVITMLTDISIGCISGVILNLIAKNLFKKKPVV